MRRAAAQKHVWRLLLCLGRVRPSAYIYQVHSRLTLQSRLSNGVNNKNLFIIHK